MSRKLVIFFLCLVLTVPFSACSGKKSAEASVSVDTEASDAETEMSEQDVPTEEVDAPSEPQQGDGFSQENDAIMMLSNYIDQPATPFSDLSGMVAAPEVKGVYVSSHVAGIDSMLSALIDLCKTSAYNAFVIDVKDDNGYVTFKGIPFADEMGISGSNIPDIKALLKRLEDEGIYPIARLVAFKDNNTYNLRPELYIKNQDGSIWKDSQGNAWLNPYNPDACSYVIDFAKAVATLGFKEIQFDYIRFSTSGKLKSADMGDIGEKTRSQAIEEFSRRAVDELRTYGVKVSADVYGTIINSDIDAEIVGQDYAVLASIFDVICPMIYPSHYANGSMGIDIPDVHPYDTIYNSLLLSEQRMQGIPPENRAIVRPWLQDFTASWLPKYIPYAGKEREDQIRAVYDAQLSEWILWDAAVKYDIAGVY